MNISNLLHSLKWVQDKQGDIKVVVVDAKGKAYDFELEVRTPVSPADKSRLVLKVKGMAQ